MSAPTPKNPSTTKTTQTNMALSFTTANPDGYPIAYADDVWDAVEQNTAMSDVMEGTGQYDQKTINEQLAGKIGSIDLSVFERIANKVIAISAQSTDVQYPTAKLLYDQLQALANVYAAKSNTYTKTEVDNLISAISTLSFQVVQSLPVSDIRTDVIYLVPSSLPSQQNIYDEYIYVNNAWECIGSTAIDLSGYELKINKVTSISAQSTDNEYPSAKLLYDSLQALSNVFARIADLASVAFSGSYNDLSNKPTIPAAQVNSDWNSNSGVSQILNKPNVEVQGNKVTVLSPQSTDNQYPSAKLLYDSLQSLSNVFAAISDLAAVAFSGNYNDLSNKPTIPAAQVNSDWNSTTGVSKILNKPNVEVVENKVTVLSPQNTDNQYPSAKAVYDCCAEVKQFLEELDERVTRLEGFHYMITGTALQGTIIIKLNGTQNTVVVESNAFEFKYKEPIQTLDFMSSNIVSVSFYDSDSLIGLTSCDELFKDCVELIAIDFSNKSFGSVVSAVDMFAGCTALTTLLFSAITEDWKPDLDLGDCPDLTKQSLEDLITKFLYSYTSGDHLIYPNLNMWDAISVSEQNRLQSLANSKHWQIVYTRYSISGTSTGNTVNATINGTAMQFPVVNGSWVYNYNDPITSISFANNTTLTSVDFSLSDLLSGLTSLDGAFSGCTTLTSIDFTGCDLSAMVSATGTFTNCTALTTIILPSASWKPDVDLSSTAISALSTFISGLYAYNSGSHFVTFSSTIWDALTEVQQQAIWDTAQLKNWTTNAVQITYYVRGTSSNVNATETFNIQFINDGAVNPSTAEQIICNVDGNGNWEFSYRRKKIYSLRNFSNSANSSLPNNTTLLTVDFSDAEGDECVYCGGSWNGAFSKCTALTSVDLSGCTFVKCMDMSDMFYNTTSLQTINWSPNLNLESLVQVGTAYHGMFQNCGCTGTLDWSTQQLPNLSSCLAWFMNSKFTHINLASAKFDKPTTTHYFSALPFGRMPNLISINLSNATFENIEDLGGMFSGDTALTTITWDLNKLNFSKAIQSTYSGVTYGLFQGCTSLTSMDLRTQTFPKLKNIGGMFSGCTSLTSVNLMGATFDEATSAINMFNGCTSLQSVDLSATPFTKLASMQSMFNGCTSLTSISLKSGITLPNVTTTQTAFQNCKALQTLDLSSVTFPELQNAANMFNGCSVLQTMNLSSATFAKCTTINNMFYNCVAITSVNLSNATFAELTDMTTVFRNCSALQTVNFKPGITLANVTTTAGLFNACSSLQTADLSGATFASCTRTGNSNLGMYYACGLPTINLPLATFGEVTDSQFMFYNSKATTLNLPIATFAKTTNCFRMFQGMTDITSITLPEATFALSTTAQVMFFGCTLATQISLPKATFASVTNANQMFTNGSVLQSISMPLATFASVTNSGNIFQNCGALANIDIPQNSTAILPTSTPSNAPMDSHWSPLTYASMLKIANWLSDLTGQTAHTCTFKSAAWNALSAAEQTNIDTILSGKNWNRAIA